MNEAVYLMSLQNKQGVGGVTLRKLIDNFGSAENVFKAELSDLVNTGFISNETAHAIKGFTKWDLYLNEYKKVSNSRFQYLTYKDNNYPENLKNIYNVPMLLHYFGTITDGDKNAVAVVGSRNCDEYGRYVTENIVKQLVECGITVVSGMARGIDTFAHRAAIKYGGRTVAVVGSGLDICYPSENKELFELIAKNGCVISEFNLGTKPESMNFPKRNRIISGLSLGVLVVQASIKSGALITARYALEQNREVFAVPANINNKRSSGSNFLIKSGAKLVESLEDLIPEIKQFDELITVRKKKNTTPVLENLSEKEKLIVTSLKQKRLHMDELQIVSRLPSSEIFPVLLDMEMRGLVRVLPGNYYELFHE